MKQATKEPNSEPEPVGLTDEEATALAIKISELPHPADPDEPIESLDRKLRNLDQFDADIRRAGKDDAVTRKMSDNARRDLRRQRQQALERNQTGR